MRRAPSIVISMFLATAVLAGCSRDGAPQLMNLSSGKRAPDEFAVLPGKPLEMPQDVAALPEPTPGGANRTDPTPHADAVAALGGNPARVARSGAVPGGDARLVSYASRHGVQGNIRETLFAEDVEYRRQNNGRLLERALNVNVYYRAYRDQSLDQHAELERWRRAGARNVGAPPRQVGE
ncbi:beta-barrel assembly complex subunit BamF [Rhodovulum imhoffii]|uniref:Beta-barrel assembly complex subunit BamF n=1 Tax=Rhodovulum imhoffii TaxID=365340 RepID=A0A2T5BV14_9RHOB|nr:DUF3035 domain-containing protein [Rhodovulum imhoffii]MBK5934667.1 pyruvate/2-oxoglutarate dehydrogenase complex, dihydrolipoamide acyltransferase (E2) component [Rhodovulum imhoffii]PTN03358.1 beta-barrel assembly complex subunit BamF [Rhodovulum imhoffii]